MQKKQELLHSLTGVGTSKLSYYTELKQKINEIEKRNAQLEIINQIAKGINVDTTVEDMLIRVARLLVKVIPLTGLGLYLTFTKAATTIITVEQKFTVKTGNIIPEVAARVLQSGNSGGVCDLNTGEIFFPLKTKEQQLGLLGVRCCKDYDMLSGDMEFLQHLAEHLSVSLENSRLYKEVVFANLRWEETFKAVTDHIILVDRDFNLLRYNEAVAKFYNLEPTSAADKCYRLLWGAEGQCDKCLVQEVIDTGRQGQGRIQIKEGVFDLNAYPVHNHRGEIYGVIQYARDITDKVHMEAQLIQSAKLAATGEMAAGVAHELNSPLTAILGNSQLLAREFADNDARRGLADNIVGSGKRCKSIIQNLLTFARQDNAPRETISLSECVNQALSLISYQINRQGVQVNVQADHPLPQVFANAQQMEQVLVNLILNARDALDSRKEDAAITISTGVDEQCGFVYVAVKDNGCGISEENLESIFQPFFTTKTEAKGYGLGLSVSLGIVQNHRGRISVSSEQGVGSTFTLLLPPVRQEEV